MPRGFATQAQSTIVNSVKKARSYWPSHPAESKQDTSTPMKSSAEKTGEATADKKWGFKLHPHKPINRNDNKSEMTLSILASCRNDSDPPSSFEGESDLTAAGKAEAMERLTDLYDRLSKSLQSHVNGHKWQGVKSEDPNERFSFTCKDDDHLTYTQKGSDNCCSIVAFMTVPADALVSGKDE